MKKMRKRIMVLLISVVIVCTAAGFLLLKENPYFPISAYAAETEETVPVPDNVETEQETVAVEESETDPVVELPEVQIVISSPEPWKKDAVKVQVQAEDIKNTGNFSISKVEARISENGAWMDITQSMEVDIRENCSVYVRITDINGQTYSHNRYIECFDKTKPTLSAAAKNGILIIQGMDEESGVAAIFVNGNEFTELDNNTLKVRLQKADTTYQYFALQVRDHAGNMSEDYKVPNPYYENPEALKEENTEAGTPEVSLPTDVMPTEPTSATATVIEHESTGTDVVEEIVLEDSDTEAGRVQNTELIPVDEGGKEFYTIQTKKDKVFYLIIDKDKTEENVYLLTEVGENDLLNFTDSDTVTLPQNNAVIESALPTIPVEPVEEETELSESEITEAEPEEMEEQGNSGTMMVMVIVLVGVGAVYYFLKKRKTSFDMDYDDDEEEDTYYEEETEQSQQEELSMDE